MPNEERIEVEKKKILAKQVIETVSFLDKRIRIGEHFTSVKHTLAIVSIWLKQSQIAKETRTNWKSEYL